MNFQINRVTHYNGSLYISETLRSGSAYFVVHAQTHFTSRPITRQQLDEQIGLVLSKKLQEISRTRRSAESALESFWMRTAEDRKEWKDREDSCGLGVSDLVRREKLKRNLLSRALVSSTRANVRAKCSITTAANFFCASSTVYFANFDMRQVSWRVVLLSHRLLHHIFLKRG